MQEPAKPPRISVRNVQRKLRVDVPALQRFAERALERALELQQTPGSALADVQEVHVAIVSDARMASVHERFLQVAGPTDVMTFQHGEILVSAETAQTNAAEYRMSLQSEIELYIVHGILHLIGFDDTTPEAARLIAKTQKRIWRAASQPEARAARTAAV